MRVVVELEDEPSDNWQGRTVGSAGVMAVAREDGFTIDVLSTGAVVQAEAIK